MSEQHTTLEESPGMLKAFENAGIVDDKTEDTSGEETQSGTDTASGTDSGTQSTDTIQGGAGKDSIDGKPDSGKKSGKEKETKDTVDPNDLKLTDGTIIKAGAERRHYETAQLTKQQLGIARNELNTANQNYTNLQTKYNELSDTVKKIGLENPAEVSSAVRLYKDLSRDLPGTLQKLLAEAKALGHTFEGVGGAIDTAAVNAILDARLPKVSQEQQGLTPEQINEQAGKDVQEFVAKFPDAVTHEAHIAALIDRSVAAGKPLSLSDAYFALKERVIADGLDWAKDLGPQLEARKTNGQQQQQKPRTPGRATVDPNPVDPTKIIQPEREMDSDSIVRAAMQEAGFKIN